MWLRFFPATDSKASGDEEASGGDEPDELDDEHRMEENREAGGEPELRTLRQVDVELGRGSFEVIV